MTAPRVVIIQDPRAASESFKRRLAKAVNMPDFNVLEAELAASEERVAARFDEIVGSKAP